MEETAYRIVRSRRKTVAVTVTRDGEVVIRCPLRMTEEAAKAFAAEHEAWIRRHVLEAKERLSHRMTYTPDEVKQFSMQARTVFEEKAAYFAGRMGVAYHRITIRGQISRWGSCSTKGNLNFNWKLMLVPEELQDYVVVHELAHLKEMNHSKRFWAVVEEVLPDYKERRKALRGYEDKINS